MDFVYFEDFLIVYFEDFMFVYFEDFTFVYFEDFMFVYFEDLTNGIFGVQAIALTPTLFPSTLPAHNLASASSLCCSAE